MKNKVWLAVYADYIEAKLNQTEVNYTVPEQQELNQTRFAK